MPILLMIFNTPAFKAFRAFSIPTFDSTAALAFLPSAGGVVNCVATRKSMYGWTAEAPYPINVATWCVDQTWAVSTTNEADILKPDEIRA